MLAIMTVQILNRQSILVDRELDKIFCCSKSETLHLQTYTSCNCACLIIRYTVARPIFNRRATSEAFLPLKRVSTSVVMRPRSASDRRADDETLDPRQGVVCVLL